MRLLLLGGTQFLGRHVVELGLARGHELTVFTRGRKALPDALRNAVTAMTGDRDPRIGPGLEALGRGTWDAVIDTSGYVPRIVEASTALLSQRVARYVFVSTISVYAKLDRPGMDEDASLAVLEAPDSEDVPNEYGALKAACEAAVARTFGARATIVRPGLIVGPHDPTDRFGYWPARFVHPGLLGDRDAYAVVPAPPERPIQCIDARDLAGWILDLVERETAGTFNATSRPGQWTFGDLIADCGEVAHSSPAAVWVPDSLLLDFHVTPWVGLPLWIPGGEPDTAGFHEVDVDRARAAGLRTRSLIDTVRDTAQWLLGRENDGAWKQVLTDARERQIVSAMRAR